MENLKEIETTICDLCDEQINLEEDFYKYGTDKNGNDVICCEHCESSEMESSATCTPYGDPNFEDGERYSYSQLFGALSPYFEELYGDEANNFPVKSIEWKNTDGWRGFYNVEFEEGWESIDGWITGWVDETIGHKNFVLEFLDDLRQEEIYPHFPIWVVTTQTSNVFSTATDIVFRESDRGELKDFILNNYGKDLNDLIKSLS